MRCSTTASVIAVSLVLSAALHAQEYPAWLRTQTPDPASTFAAPPGFNATPAPVEVVPATFEMASPVQEPLVTPSKDFVTSNAYGNCPSCPSTYAWADALYWHRVGTGCDQVLVTNTSLPPGADTVLRTSDLHFNGTGGFRVLVGWRPDPACCPCCSAFELSYWGLFGLNANQTARSSAGTLAIPGDLGLASNNFFLTNVLNVNYQSQLNNVEFNCIKSCCLCCGNQIDFLCGFRYINLNETFKITGTDFQEGMSNYNVHSDNNLYGLQMGGRYTRQWTDLWSLQLTAKSGVFLNDIHQTQAATDFPNNTGPFSLRDRVSARGSAVAMLGELDFILIRRLNDTWSLRLGYTVIGLGGLALAPDQLDFTDTATSGTQLNSNGWIFVHGAVLGLQARW
jgi:Putative beta barrel porin-7 (BBP7)